jgi:hypothetical protein
MNKPPFFTNPWGFPANAPVIGQSSMPSRSSIEQALYADAVRSNGKRVLPSSGIDQIVESILEQAHRDQYSAKPLATQIVDSAFCRVRRFLLRCLRQRVPDEPLTPQINRPAFGGLAELLRHLGGRAAGMAGFDLRPIAVRIANALRHQAAALIRLFAVVDR